MVILKMGSEKYFKKQLNSVMVCGSWQIYRHFLLYKSTCSGEMGNRRNKAIQEDNPNFLNLKLRSLEVYIKGNSLIFFL